MKNHHILLIIALAVAVGVLISTTTSSSEYASFSEASRRPDTQFTLVGNINKEKPIEYNPHVNPNLVTFYMIDKEGTEFKVILNSSKPQDMERSEDVVVKGRCGGDTFYANSILLKCPSKYVEKRKFQTSSL